MIAILSGSTAPELAASLIEFGLNWLLQSTALIVAGLSIGHVLRRQGSAAQSAIYRTTLVAVLACPLFSWSLSFAGINGWSLELTSRTHVGKNGTSVSLPNNPSTGAIETVSAGVPDSTTDHSKALSGSINDQMSAVSSDPSSDSSSKFASSTASISKHATTDVNSDAPATFESHNEGPRSFWKALFQPAAFSFSLLWIFFATWMSMRLAFAWWRLGRIRHRAAPADSAAIETCRVYADRLGVKPPRVMETPFLPSPCLAGLRDPIILLPEESLTLALDDVIIHELAHLLRHDCHWNLLRNLATTVFWFHPLLWTLSRRLEMSAEEVCDDFVVTFGANREEYACRLVDVAEFSSASMAMAGVAIVSLRSMLAHRVTRIMDYSRQLSTRTSHTLLTCTLIGGLVGTAIVGFVGAAPPLSNADEPKTGQTVAEKNSDQQLKGEEVALREKPDQVKKEVNALGQDQEALREEQERIRAAAVINIEKPDRVKKEVNAPLEEHEQNGMARVIDGDLYTVCGRVLTPDGQPAAGARVTARRIHYSARTRRRPVAESIADAAGRFKITYRASQIDVTEGHSAEAVYIVAQAEGFGLQWVTARELMSAKNLVLKLVPDEAIRGRVTDLEGQPIEGVNVRLHQINAAKADKGLEPWIESMKSGTPESALVSQLGSWLKYCDDDERPATTDKDGRFTLHGIGPERLARLELRGDSIAWRMIDVATRDMPPVTRVVFARDVPGPPRLKDLVFGNDFTYQAAPMRLIEGTVRDAATGMPVAGATIESSLIAGTPFVSKSELRTQTDLQGNYRLLGMPKGEGDDPYQQNAINIFSNNTTPYLMRTIKIPNTPGMAPSKLDIEVHRGSWMTGKVTDQVTGKPIRAAVFAFPFLDNPFTRNLPEFSGGKMDHVQSAYVTDQDGNYRFPGIPGHSIVAVTGSMGGRYRKGIGADSIKGLTKTGKFPTYGAPTPAGNDYYALKEINIDDGVDMVVCDFALDPGGTIHATIVDPDGKPVDGCLIQGHIAWNSNNPQAQTSEFDVITLSPNEHRTIVVTHLQRKLSKILEVVYDENKVEPITVTLEPSSTIKGRLVDRDGDPYSSLQITVEFICKTRPLIQPQHFLCQGDGTFEYSDLPMGCESYGLFAIAPKIGFASIAKEITARPGQTINLGDVTLKPRN